MSISIASTTFASTYYGTPHAPEFDFSRSSQVFFGLAGEYNLYGQAHSRTITIPYYLTGFSTQLALQQARAVLTVAVGTYGTLTYDLGGGDSTPFTFCTFEGFQPSENPWKDGSGTNGWNQAGTLIFRQSLA